MTSSQIRALLQRVATRSGICGLAPTMEARIVLQALLGYLLRLQNIPSQADIAANAGLEERRVNAAVRELSEAGFLSLTSRGNQPGDYVFDFERIDKWSRGLVTVPPRAPDLSLQDSGANGDLRRENGGVNGGLDHRNGGAPRADASMSSSSSVSPTRSQTWTPPSTVPSSEALKAARKRISHGGVVMPFGLLPRVAEYMVRGATEDDLALAAIETAAQGSNRWSYMVTILDDMGFGPPPEEPSDHPDGLFSIGDYRARGMA